MKKSILIITAVTALFAGSSCSDMLDIPQHGTLNYETYYNTDEEAETAVTNLYLTMRGMEYNLKLTKHLLCDDFWAGGGGRGDNGDLEQLNEFTFNTDQSFLQGVFEGYYQMIYQANVVLGHVDESSDIKKQMRAEAKVFRAIAYFDLISMWGNPPLVDHELTPEEYAKPNGTTEELWALVEKDLTEAIGSGLLAEKKNVDDKDVWRITKQYAQALLGKAYLWQKKYAEAAKEFDNVIGSGKYDLYKGPYEDIIQYNNEKNCETLFESVKVSDANNAFDNFSFYLTMLFWRTDCMEGIVEAGFTSMGWGFCNPRKALYDDFVKEEGVDGYRLNNTLKTVEQMKAMGIGVMPGKTTINEGYYMWKWRVPAEAETPGGWSSATVNVNPRWMRLAEVYLLGSEAHLMAGNQGKADEYLNKVRGRAKASLKTGVKLADIQVEKRLELCGEGVRYQDLIRWGIASEKMKDQGKNCPLLDSNGNIEYKVYNTDANRFGFKEKHNLLPYPGVEIRLNPNIKQNPGW